MAHNARAEAAYASEAILKVQDEVTMLRTQLMRLTAGSHGNGQAMTSAPTLQELNDIVAAAEKNIGREAERLAFSDQGCVSVLPPLSSADTVMRTSPKKQHYSKMTKSRKQYPKARAGKGGYTGISPGEALKLNREREALANPRSIHHQAAVTERFGELTKEKDSANSASSPTKKKMPTRQQPTQLSTLTHRQRRDPQLPPPPITREDARRGLLSLMERGLIPPATDVIMDPALVNKKQLHVKEVTSRKPAVVMDEMEASAGGVFLTGIKLRSSLSHGSQVDLEDDVIPDQPSSSAVSLLRNNTEISDMMDVQSISDHISTLPDETIPAGETSTALASAVLSASTSTTRDDISPSSYPPTKFSETVSANQKPVVTVTSIEYDSREPDITLLPSTPPGTKQKPHRVKTIVIQHGVTVKTSPEFRDFRREQGTQWPRSLMLLRGFEDMLGEYSVPLAFVDTEKFDILVKEFRTEGKPNRWDFLSCCLNDADVESLMRRSGQRYQSDKGRELAVLKIQSTWRMHVVRSQWREFRRRKWAAGVLCMAWMLNLKYRALRTALVEAKMKRLERFNARHDRLRAVWPRLKNVSHNVLHLPSLGYSQQVRQSVSEFNLLQNIQVGRLAETVDPLKEVFYISPMEFDEHMKDYSSNLLKAGDMFAKQLVKKFEDDNDSRSVSRSSGRSASASSSRKPKWRGSSDVDTGEMVAADAMFIVPPDSDAKRRHITGKSRPVAVSSHTAGVFSEESQTESPGTTDDSRGNENDQQDSDGEAEAAKSKTRLSISRPAWERYTVLAPTELKTFEMHNFALASSLLYSTVTMQRLRNLTVGLDGYIVPGIVSDADMQVADFLDLPLLCPAPSVAEQLSSKSGARTVFTQANLPCAPGDSYINSQAKLSCSLGQLILDNLDITRWLFKLNNETGTRGIAYVDIENTLPCRQWLIYEANRFGDKWNKRWAQELALNRVERDIPELLVNYLTPASASIYSDSKSFLSAAYTEGIVIEACPRSSSTTTVTADMLLEPDGHMSLLCTTDQIHSSEYHCEGYSLPQTSIEPERLLRLCERLARHLQRQKGVIGYCRLDFVTFFKEQENEQVVWATDLKFGYSNSLALSQLSMYMSCSMFDARSGCVRQRQPIATSQNDILAGAYPVQLVAGSQTALRFAVMSNTLRNSNMVLTRFDVFFQMCKGHHIGYNMKDGTGTVFQLTDSVKRHALGMISIASTLPEALSEFASNLNIIHQEISPKGRDGRQNFTVLLAALDKIINEAKENQEDLLSNPSSEDA